MSDSQGSGIYPVTVPKWGIEMQEGTITGWLVELGETIEKGKDLVDIETDKIVNTMESPATGILRRQLVGEGDTLKVGELLGVIATTEMDDARIDAFVESFVPADASFGVGEDFPETPVASEQKSAEPATAATGDSHSSDQAVAVSPIARRLAEQLGVDLSKIKPSGRGGRISKEDVEQAAAQQAAGTQKSDSDYPATEPKVTRLSGRALTQARRMVEAKQNIPHFYLGREMDMRAALDAQQLLDVPLTSLIVQAVVRAIGAQPAMNAHFINDGIHHLSSIGINIAIDTPDGLVAPLLPDLADSDAVQIAEKLKTLAERARARELKAEDLQPGSMTLSNLGMFGISQFSAIINPPQTSILAVGVVRPILMEMDGPMIPAMNATLSCDHRALDGAAGARFLQALQKSLLEI
jgi:pyruvate dehydrogenase E2 component (dihydrolipoamide acetyltransferase)